MMQISCAIIKEEDAEKATGFLSCISRIIFDPNSRELNRSMEETGNVLFVGPRDGSYYLLYTDNMFSKPHAIIDYLKKRGVGCVMIGIDHLGKLKKSEKSEHTILNIPDDLLEIFHHNTSVILKNKYIKRQKHSI